MTIPATFRKDLKLYPGPKEPNGSPSFNLYDPLNAKYYKLGWEESYIYKLAREGMSFAEIANEVNKNSTFTLDEEEVENFYRQVAMLGLLNIPKSSEQILKEYHRNKGNVFWWGLMHYLYFRIRLFKPDRFLTKTLPYVKILWSKPAIIIYITATIFGLISALGRWDEYLHTFTYFFNFEGILMYAAAICVLKVIHELAHAYTAKYYNIYVPGMGAAIILLWPVLYTDVTDSWKLSNRKQRLAISIAGVTAELVIAGLSTFGWAISSPGVLQSIFFLLSSTTWISSLFINFNPAMRFDGYYILSDLWGIDNLRQRSFAITRWKIQEFLFGLNSPPPETDLSAKRIFGMEIYSIFTWAYLLTLYTLVALFVYFKFAKAIGIILFFAEIAIFFVWPVIYELQALYKLRSNFRINMRLIITLTLFTALILWAILPLPRHEQVASITVPDKVQNLYVVEEGKIKDIFFKQGDSIQKGETVIQIEQKKVELEISKESEEMKMLKKLSEISTLDETQNALLPQLRAESLSSHDRLEALNATKNYLFLKAQISGQLFALDDSLRVGQSISKNQTIGKIADLSKLSVVAFVPERLIKNITLGQKVEFSLPYTATKYHGIVQDIDPIPTSTLEFPSLGSRFHGPLAVSYEASTKSLKLIDNYYRVKISLQNNTDLPFGKIGVVTIKTPPESLVVRISKYLYNLLVQESAL